MATLHRSLEISHYSQADNEDWSLQCPGKKDMTATSITDQLLLYSKLKDVLMWDFNL